MTDADSLDQAWGSTDGAPALTWQVNTRGRKTSEMTLAELGASIKAGKLTARTLVWSDGMSEWTPLGDVPSLAKLLRDSTPPPSGTRPRLEELVGGSRPYTLSSDATTDTGGIAIYERPLALIEFPKELADVEDYTGRLEELSEPEDEPTRAVITPTRVITPAPRPTVPASATASLRSRPSAPRPKAPDPAEPALPPLPPMRSVQPTLPLFPAPVSASPLGAALSSTAEVPAQAKAEASQPSASKGTETSAGEAKATSVATTATVSNASADTAPSIAATSSASADTTASTAATSSAGVDSDEPASDAAPTVKRPRPAIEHLPPIIVHEKEDDDGASAILELPLHPPPRDPLPGLREAPFSESTLVLSGRRRARRWIPLNAAISLGIGAACLASALTAVTVRTRPAPPRVVEKIVTVPAPVVPAPDTAARAARANAPGPSEHDAQPTKSADATRPSAVDRTAKSDSPRAETTKPDAAKSEARAAGTKSDPANTDLTKSEAPAAHNRDAARPDPSGLDTEMKPNATRREARAGFPTNPGF